MVDTSGARANAVAETMDRIRSIESTQGVTPGGLDAIKAELVALAAQRELFSSEHFPPPAAADRRDSVVYRLAQDDDDRFALYIQSTDGIVESKAHNHTTWACIVGLDGAEHNQFFDRDDEGRLTKTSTATVGPGTGVTMLPDDVHAIRIEGEALMFHCYGLALERLTEREFFDAETNTWVTTAGAPPIVEARVDVEA